MQDDPKAHFDGIIVDGDQDFDEVGRDLVEAALVHPDLGSLFVFYHKNQRAVHQESRFLASPVYLADELLLGLIGRRRASCHSHMSSFHGLLNLTIRP